MPDDIVGVLLAGGLSRRMGGGDKGLASLAGRPMLSRIIARVRPQVAGLVINANGDPARFAPFGLPVAPDEIDGFAGPLAGVLSGMMWAKVSMPTALWLASVATDVPFVPHDLVTRLYEAASRDDALIACAASNGRSHPVIALWSMTLVDDLRRALVDEGVRKVDAWTARYRVATVEFPSLPLDPFFNVNGPDDLEAASRLIATRDD